MADVNLVSSAKPAVGGAVYTAPLGTALPTDATTALDKAFKALGYISEDGVTNSNSAENEDIKAWGGQVVLSSQTEKTDTFQCKLIEILNVEVLKAVYGADNVTGTLETGITVTANDAEAQEAVWVFDMILKNNVLKRIVIPQGKITEMDDIEYVMDDAVGYDVTITCLAQEGYGNHKEFISKPTTAGA